MTERRINRLERKFVEIRPKNIALIFEEIKFRSILDRDRDGLVHRSDAEAAIKKFKKSLSAVVAATILKSFDGDNEGGGGKRGGFEGGMSYDAFCDVMNGLAVTEKEKEKEGESKTKESRPANKTEASEKRQRRPSKKRKN